jgi:CheY-like chemotaxis protein
MTAEKPLTDFRILLVEDSLDNQFLIKKLLTKKGATVEVVDNGFAGVHRALESNFDVVLMDIQMPTMDGYSAIQKLKENNYSQPVIALTAHAMTEERMLTKKAGFAAHVTKPITFDLLIDSIRSVAKARPQ